MPAVSLGFTEFFNFEPPQVYLASEFATGFVLEPRLRALSCNRTTGRSISGASLALEYGGILGSSLIAVSETGVVPGKWVKIVWTPESGAIGSVYWYGVLIDAALQAFGSDDEAVGTTFKGNVRYRAAGIELFLTKKQVLSSWVLKTPGQPASEVKFGIPFNAGRGRLNSPMEVVGNQANVLDADGEKTFDDKLSNPRPWNAKEILEYLIHFHNPFPAGFAVSLGGGALNDLAAYTPAEVQTHGRTLFDIFQQVIDFRRGLVWWLDFADLTTPTVTIKVETMAPANFSIPGTSFTMHANTNQLALTLAEPRIISSIALQESKTRQYAQVIAEGARIGYLQTRRCGSAELPKDWSSGDATAYNAGASTTAGYGALDRDDKKARNDAMRMGDPTLSKVYTSFVHDPDDVKDWRYLSNATELTLRDETWAAGWQVESYLPLREGWDYSTTPNPTPSASGQYAPFMGMLCYAKADGKVYVDFANPSAVVLTERLSGGLYFSMRAEPSQGIAGIRLNPSAPPHALGASSPNGTTVDTTFDVATAEPSDFTPQVCWGDVHVTYYVTTSKAIRVAYPDTPAASDLQSVLLLRYGERAHFDKCVTDVTFRVEANAVKTISSGRMIRDDREFLRVVARTAYEWHKSQRIAVLLEVRTLTDVFGIGQLVSSIDGKAIDSVVTAIEWNFETFSTRMETEFAELDFEGIVL